MGHDANETLRIGDTARDAYRIGADNPLIGLPVKVTWLRQWGGRPAGYTLEGVLKATFVVGGRTLIGEVTLPSGVSKSCPWSRNYITVEVSQ